MSAILKVGRHCWLPVTSAANPQRMPRPPPTAVFNCAACCCLWGQMLMLPTRTSSDPCTWPAAMATQPLYSCSCPVVSALMPWTTGDTRLCTVLCSVQLQQWPTALSIQCEIYSIMVLSESGQGHSPRYRGRGAGGWVCISKQLGALEQTEGLLLPWNKSSKVREGIQQQQVHVNRYVCEYTRV